MSEINIDSVDLNLIRLFVAVYEEKSATRAGLRLDQTQSAVSFSLTKLRHLYNDPLFVRTFPHTRRPLQRPNNNNRHVG